MTTLREGAFVRRPGEGRSIDLGNFAMSVKAERSSTGGAFTLLEAAEPPDFGPPLHIHTDAAEAFYILEGEYRVFIADEVHACPAGSFIYIPAGVQHGFRVGRVPSRKLNLYTPAAMVGSAAITSGTGDLDRFDEIARRHGMDIVGPVPEDYL